MNREVFKKFKSKHFLVVGMGIKTGLQTTNFLLKHNIKVSITDSKKENEIKNVTELLIKKPNNAFYGTQTSEQLKDINALIISPGVPLTIPLIRDAKERCVEIYSEIEFAYLLCENANIISITGTDGKSTTTALIHELLKTHRKSFIGGNFGIPFISFVEDVKEKDYVVLELSSYQLELNKHMRSNVALLLNISADHLDRYKNIQNYMDAKTNIFKNQKDNDIAVLNMDDKYHEYFKNFCKAGRTFFSKKSKVANAYSENNHIFYDNEIIVDNINSIYLKGVHNLENVLASVCAVKHYGLSNDNINKVLTTFKGLPHRTEFVGSINGVDFINDSKATTTNSVEKAINSQQKPILLIMGGQGKGLDYSTIKHAVMDKVKTLALIGEAKDEINSQLQFPNTILLKNLEEAMETLFKQSNNGEVILLSPACTSFDQYKNYEERGEHFKQLYKEMDKKYNKSNK